MNYADYQKVKKFLDKNGIDSILYGSLGASVYLGRFKEFDDIDLLIDRKYVEKDWKKLVEIMKDNGFEILDEKEHEFINKGKIKVAFAGDHVLMRDKICDPKKEVITIVKENVQIKTLSKGAFIKAYLFSAKDGYRREKRGKKDFEVIEKLKKLI